MKRIIVGIDPGTTAGIAALDIQGNLVLLKSIKNATHGEISKAIIDAGKPVIIASDVSPLPKMLEKVAASFAAKVMFPEERLTRVDKLNIAEKYSKEVSPEKKLWSNRHERDALAAALRAWRSKRHLLMKLEADVSGMGSERANKIIECVLLKGRPIEECRRRYA